MRRGRVAVCVGQHPPDTRAPSAARREARAPTGARREQRRAHVKVYELKRKETSSTLTCDEAKTDPRAPAAAPPPATLHGSLVSIEARISI